MGEFDYKPNSFKSKEERNETSEPVKKVEKVITGNVKTKKKGEMQKLANVFISEDISNVKSYVFMDVLVPAIKKAVFDIITDGLDMILYGGEGRRKKTLNAEKVSYRSYYNRKNEDDRKYDRTRERTVYSYDEVIFDSRSEAEEVLERMDELITEYKMVTVSDLYDLVGISGKYTDCKYGWTNLRNVEPIRVRDGGYMLNLPKPRPLD